jgi:predicted GNAT family acetyltransferase
VERDGALISVAGVLSVSRKYSTGTVGNVATHPDYRGRGLAKASTRAVVEQLWRDGIRNIVLNADADNTPAVRAYEGLGFEKYVEYQDGAGEH